MATFQPSIFFGLLSTPIMMILLFFSFSKCQLIEQWPTLPACSHLLGRSREHKGQLRVLYHWFCNIWITTDQQRQGEKKPSIALETNNSILVNSICLQELLGALNLHYTPKKSQLLSAKQVTRKLCKKEGCKHMCLQSFKSTLKIENFSRTHLSHGSPV